MKELKEEQKYEEKDEAFTNRKWTKMTLYEV